MDPTRSGVVLTFVLPARQCDLRCPACIIHQRREAESHILSVSDYLFFIDEVTSATSVTRINVQGYEPLLPEAWPYTESVMRLALAKGIPAGLVTNGTHLDQYVVSLAGLSPATLVVSLDAPTAAEHDKQRGVVGAFDRTLRGLLAAADHPQLASRLSVASVLHPKKHAVLLGMPSLLSEIGISSWSVTPLIRAGNRSRPGGFVEPIGQLVDTMRHLAHSAWAHGVRLSVDDEFDLLSKHRSLGVGADRRSIARARNLLRLDPSGGLSVGRDLLRVVDESTPRWRPGVEGPADFVRRAAPHLALSRAA